MLRFSEYVKLLKKHIHIKRLQNAKFNSLKANLEHNEVMIQVDYSKNYANKDQGQIQSVYFGQRGFSIFIACCYLNVDGVLVNENVTVTSEANGHSRIVALSCWLRFYHFCKKSIRYSKIRWSCTSGVIVVQTNFAQDLSLAFYLNSPLRIKYFGTIMSAITTKARWTGLVNHQKSCFPWREVRESKHRERRTFCFIICKWNSKRNLRPLCTCRWKMSYRNQSAQKCTEDTWHTGSAQNSKGFQCRWYV